MTDYYVLLSRTVAASPQTTPETREAIYEHARKTLEEQLRNSASPLTEIEAMAEQTALDQAIARIESEVKEQATKLQSVRPLEGRRVQAGQGSWIADLLARASRDDGGAPLPAEKPAPRPSELPSELPRLRLPELKRSSGRVAHLTQVKPMSRLDDLNQILRKLKSESPGVEASALISEDGLMIASSLGADMEETRVAGMAATLQNLGGRAAVELARGSVREVIVRGDRGYAVMISAGRNAVLLALANDSSKLGLIFFDMQKAIKALQNVL